MTIYDQFIIRRPEWADDPIGRRWWDFHVAHPEVYGTLLRFCDEWSAARPGRKCGMKMLWERLRWEHAIGNVGGDFKLNNNFTACYARYIMERSEREGPDRFRYAGLFETRERRCEVVADKPDPPWGEPGPAEMDEDAAWVDSLGPRHPDGLEESGALDRVQPWE